MGHKAILATCALRQQTLDFAGNMQRILESIQRARQAGATLRVGPELEVTGYGCWDHFLEGDTFLHAWEVLASILEAPEARGIICDVGMPVVHQNIRYNCRVVILNGRILLIRPKMVLADSGNYHEARYFAAWPRHRFEEHQLPRIIQSITGQGMVPFGEAVIATADACIAFEVCEEFFVSNCPHATMALDGVKIFANGSASHHELGKFASKTALLRGAMQRAGGVYLYAVAVGCDGDCLFYDAGALIVSNGDIFAGTAQFTLEDVLVATAAVDLEDVRTFRGTMQSMATQANYVQRYPRVSVHFGLSDPRIVFPSAAEEIAKAPALWMFDYLRQSGSLGFFLPLSGGLDSASVALLVYSLSDMLAEACGSQNARVLDFVRAGLGVGEEPPSPRAICRRLLLTSYLSTPSSSPATRANAQSLSAAINAEHLDLALDTIVSAAVGVVQAALRMLPRFRGAGGSDAEHVALENLQARTRMVAGYFVAQLAPTALSRPGPLLVLAAGNASECLRGYYTKYDSSSGDLSPIGSLDKADLRAFAGHMAERFPHLHGAVHAILETTPSAELSPPEDGPQADEAEMGMSYEDLALLGRLRSVKRCGPFSMYEKVCELRPRADPAANSDLVQRLLHHYSANRHKAATLPPACHVRPGSPDDNRFDLRPLVYPRRWEWQIRRIQSQIEPHTPQGGQPG